MVQLRKNEEELTKEIMGKISLSKDKVNLEKHVVNLTKCVVDLSKKSNIDLGSAKAKVVVVLDYSGSMCKLYSNGTVQKTINRLVPLGLSFDDNGSIDVYLFQNDYRKLEDLDLSNYEDYVKTVVNTAGYSMGGTNYAPVLRAIIEGSSYVYVSLMKMIVFAMLLLSVLVMAFVLHLLVKMMLQRRKQEYGILKSLGFTTGQLILQTALCFMRHIQGSTP